MLTKKRRKEISNLHARFSSEEYREYEMVAAALRDLLETIDELQATADILIKQVNEELPRVCEQCYSNLVIKKGRLCCPKGHEINVG